MNGEEFYEDPSTRVQRAENCYYQNNAVRIDCGVAPQSGRPSEPIGAPPPPRRSPTGQKPSKFLITRWVILFSFIIGIFILQVFTTIHSQDNSSDSSSPPLAPSPATTNLSSSTAGSCIELRRQGINEDGVYEIQTDKETFKFQTYCDMTTDGGGWTLVASIHENNIKSKCGSQDAWSDYGARELAAHRGKTAWENNLIIGSLEELSNADYKSRGYFQLNASNVMIWHVANGVHLDGLKKSASMRYRTTNSFLQNFGGNLQSLYKKYPVSPVLETEYGQVLQNRTEKSLQALFRTATAIRNHITDWYQYIYDNINGNQIRGDPMYGTYGNQIYFYCQTTQILLQYGQSIQCDKSYFTASAQTHPFFAVGSIINEGRKISSYRIQVTSYRPTTTNNFTLTSNVLQNGNYKLQYHLVQHSAIGYNTASEFHFIVTNVQDWHSYEPTSYTYSGSGTSSGNYKYSFIYAEGYPSNFVMGYVLLAKKNAEIVSTDQAGNVASDILEEYSSLPNLFSDFLDESLSFKVPVTFDRGSTSEILEMIPSNFRSKVQPGFLQFRPFNMLGFANAFCPGIRTNYHSPEYVCVGGISPDINTYGTCGDFAGWEGQKIPGGDTIIPGTYHNHNDMSTTFLIFYR